MTISLVSKKYPKKLIRHLLEERNFEVKSVSKGIYYVIGDKIPIQIIVTKELSQKENLWLRNLTDDLEENEEVEELIQDYKAHSKNTLYQSIMNIIVQANEEKFEEEKNMCEALRNLFKDELDAMKIEGERAGQEIGKEIGEHNKLLELVEKNLNKGKTAEVIADFLGESVEAVLAIMEEIKMSKAV